MENVCSKNAFAFLPNQFYEIFTKMYYFSDQPKNGFHPKSSNNMPADALELKLQANHEYEMEKYSNAIEIYNKALAVCLHPILLSNRAAAYIKRNWNGDIYSALLDSYQVISMDSTHIKAHLR